MPGMTCSGIVQRAVFVRAGRRRTCEARDHGEALYGICARRKQGKAASGGSQHGGRRVRPLHSIDVGFVGTPCAWNNECSTDKHLAKHNTTIHNKGERDTVTKARK